MNFCAMAPWMHIRSTIWEDRIIWCRTTLEARWAAPSGKHTFFFVNYEGLRHVQTDAMTDTVPTSEDVSGDFSMSGVTFTIPNTTREPQLQPEPSGQQTEPTVHPPAVF